jgi:hypothetical protein
MLKLMMRMVGCLLRYARVSIFLYVYKLLSLRIISMSRVKWGNEQIVEFNKRTPTNRVGINAKTSVTRKNIRNEKGQPREVHQNDDVIYGKRNKVGQDEDNDPEVPPAKRRPRHEWEFSQRLAKAEQNKAEKDKANALASKNVVVNAESRADRIQRLVGVSEAEFNKDQMKYFGKILEYGGFPVSVDKYLDHLESHPNAPKSGGKRKTRKRTVRRTRKH